jgi:two-component sensor histidine kinase
MSSRWLAIFMCIPLIGASQSKIDSLKTLLETAKKEGSKRNISFYQSHIGWNFLALSQYDSALRYYYESLNSLDSKPELTASTLECMGVAYSSKDYPDSSIHYYNKALTLYAELRDTVHSVSIEGNLAFIYEDMGLYEKALESAFNALTKLEDQKPNRTLASCYNTIGFIYSKTEDYPNALTYYTKALAVRRQMGYAKGVAQSYNNIGELYIRSHQYDSALANLFRSEAIKRKMEDKNALGVTLNNIGEVYLALSNAKKGEAYFIESLGIKRESGERLGEVIALNNLGGLKISQRDYKRAEIRLDEAETLVRKVGALDHLRKTLELKVKLYKAMNNYPTAFRYTEELLVIKDSLLNKDKIESLVAMQTLYETEKKEQHIALLQQEKELQRAEINTKMSWIRLLVVSIVLITIIGALSFYSYRLNRRSKRRAEMHLKELHHRVKNNLQILSSVFTLQSQYLTDATAIQAVKSSEGRVNAMALIHKKLYNGDKNLDINLNEYITELIQYLVQSYGYAQKELKLNVEIEAIRLDVDKAIPIGLIINELVSNAFKYAYTNQEHPELNVNLKLQGKEHLLVEISDNGNGTSTEIKIESPQSFGLKMVTILTKELHGKLNVQTNNGTGFYFNIPVSH